eukprot:10754561-Ditylum_brightwellii.AAC.1
MEKLEVKDLSMLGVKQVLGERGVYRKGCLEKGDCSPVHAPSNTITCNLYYQMRVSLLPPTTSSYGHQPLSPMLHSYWSLVNGGTMP